MTCSLQLAAAGLKCAGEYDPVTNPIGFLDCLKEAAKSCTMACVCDFICNSYPKACAECKSSDNLIKGEDCCPLKSVGGTLYKFVEYISEEERKRLKCSNKCAYKHAEKDSDVKYCFKPGTLKSSCEEAGR